MTEEHRTEKGELTPDELNKVTGGAGAKPKSPPPPPTEHQFEIDDFSFDIEQVLNIGS